MVHHFKENLLEIPIQCEFLKKRDFTSDFSEMGHLGPVLEILMRSKLVKSTQGIYYFRSENLGHGVFFIHIPLF